MSAIKDKNHTSKYIILVSHRLFIQILLNEGFKSLSVSHLLRIPQMCYLILLLYNTVQRKHKVSRYTLVGHLDSLWMGNR